MKTDSQRICRQLNIGAGKPIKKLPKTLTVAPNTSGEELHNAIALASGASVHRLRITKGSDRSVVPNAKDTTINDAGLRESSVIHVKDLGTYFNRSPKLSETMGPMPRKYPRKWISKLTYNLYI